MVKLKKLKKKKIEKEYIEKEIVNINIVSIFIDSFFFDFFNPFLPKLSEVDLKTLLINMGISNKMPITFQNN